MTTQTMPNPTDKAQRSRNIRLAILLGLLALAFYGGFILLTAVR